MWALNDESILLVAWGNRHVCIKFVVHTDNNISYVVYTDSLSHIESGIVQSKLRYSKRRCGKTYTMQKSMLGVKNVTIGIRKVKSHAIVEDMEKGIYPPLF